jgi:hypothetical protein
MSITTPARRLWSFFTRPRGPSANLALSRIQRRARDLMSLASVAGFFAVVGWLTVAGMVLTLSHTPSVDRSSAQTVLEHWQLMPKQAFDTWLLILSWLLAFIATMAPIMCLRQLGKALYTRSPLSLVVARRFHFLGHALVANIFIGFAAAWIAASQIKEYQISFSLGFWGTFIAAILAYVVAEMVREGARAAEENREFV